MTRRVCHCAVVISRLSTTAGTESWARLAINDTSSAESHKALRDLKRSIGRLCNLKHAPYNHATGKYMIIYRESVLYF